MASSKKSHSSTQSSPEKKGAPPTRDIRERDAVKKIRSIAKDVKVAMLCTDLGSVPVSVRPMVTQGVDDDGTIWFFATRTGNHQGEILTDHRAQVIYAHPGHSTYASLYGEADVVIDRDKVEELWSTAAKAWFPEGKDDPDLYLIRFVPEEGHYWDTEHGRMITLIRMVASTLTDRSPDLGVGGSLQP